MCTSSFLVLVLCVYTSKPLVLGVLVSGCAVRDVMATKLLVIGVISNYLAPAVWSLISDHCANSFNVINSLIIHHRGLEEGDVGQRLFCHHLLPTALGPRGQEEDWIKHCRYFTPFDWSHPKFEFWSENLLFFTLNFPNYLFEISNQAFHIISTWVHLWVSRRETLPHTQGGHHCDTDVTRGQGWIGRAGRVTLHSAIRYWGRAKIIKKENWGGGWKLSLN